MATTSRFEVRSWVDSQGRAGFQVWDNNKNSYAYRKNLDNGLAVPAQYAGLVDSHKYATLRAKALNQYGYTADVAAAIASGRVVGTQRSTIDNLISRISEEVEDDAPTFDFEQFRPQIEKKLHEQVDEVARSIQQHITANQITVLNDTAQKAAEITARVDADVSMILDLVEEAKTMIKSTQKIEIVSERGSKVLEGLQHYRFPDLLKIVNAGVLPFIVGPAGTGKTTIAKQIADAIDLPFHPMSTNSQTTKSDMMGFITGNGNYIRTPFRNAYEHGGVLLLDEIDAANANVLLAMNMGLAGQWASFPDGTVQRHKDFICIAAGNTFGQGANRVYVGRNQLDAASLDRFAIFELPIDEDLEGSIVSIYSNGKRWHDAIKKVRVHANAQNWHVMVSPRATIDGAKLLDAGLSLEKVIEMRLFNGATQDQRNVIAELAVKGFNGES